MLRKYNDSKNYNELLKYNGNFSVAKESGDFKFKLRIKDLLQNKIVFESGKLNDAKVAISYANKSGSWDSNTNTYYLPIVTNGSKFFVQKGTGEVPGYPVNPFGDAYTSAYEIVSSQNLIGGAYETTDRLNFLQSEYNPKYSIDRILYNKSNRSVSIKFNPNQEVKLYADGATDKNSSPVGQNTLALNTKYHIGTEQYNNPDRNGEFEASDLKGNLGGELIRTIGNVSLSFNVSKHDIGTIQIVDGLYSTANITFTVDANPISACKLYGYNDLGDTIDDILTEYPGNKTERWVDVTSAISNNTVSIKIDKKDFIGNWTFYARIDDDPEFNLNEEGSSGTFALGEIKGIKYAAAIERHYNYIWRAADATNIITMTTKLDTPVITLSQSGKDLSWRRIQSATKYVLYDNDIAIQNYSSDTTTINLPNKVLSQGVHSIYIKAMYGDAEAYSSKSNSINTRIGLMTAPTIQWTDSGQLEVTNLMKLIDGTYAGFIVKYGADIDHTSIAGKILTTVGTVTSPTKAIDILNLIENLDLGNTIIQVVPSSEGYIYNELTGEYLIFQNSYINDQGQQIEVRSNIIHYVNEKLTTPVLSLNQDESKISWLEVVDAKNYEIYINDVLTSTTTGLSYIITNIVNTVSAYIIANPIEDISTPDIYMHYAKSDKSNVVSFGKLEAPTLTSDLNVLSWNKITNADFYTIYNEGNRYFTTNETSYAITTEIPHMYYFTVRAGSDSDNILASNDSNEVIMSFNQLARPSVSYNQNDNTAKIAFSLSGYTDITYNDIYYDIYINNSLYAIQQDAIIDLSKIKQGSYNLKVQARCTNPLYIKSDYSNTIAITNVIDSQYTIFINDKHEDKQKEYSLQVPFTALFTIDDTLDIASCVLALNDDPEPFEAYTECRININTSDGTGQVNTSNDYSLLIEEDRVTEVQKGTQIKYKHNLTLIERTKLLEGVIVPDLAVTQPVSIFYPKNILEADTGGYSLFSSAMQADSYLFDHLILLTHKRSIQIQDPYLESMFKEYAENDKIRLPQYLINNISAITDTNAILKKNKWADKKTYNNVTRNWFIRKHDDNTSYTYEEDVAWAKTQTADYSIKSNETINTDPIARGTYDIIFNLESFNDNGINIEFMTDQKKHSEFSFNNKDDFANYWHVPCYIVWHDVTVKARDAATEDEQEAINNTQYIGSVIKKVLNAVEPLEFKNGYGFKSTPKYKLAPETEAYINNLGILSPEFTWTGGKSLYEILTDIGREFSGIPRLLPNNIITFDILNFTRESNEVKLQSLSEKASTIDNHSTSFTTMLQNLISEDVREVFPSANGWISPKSTSETDAYVMKSNMGLVLPKPIYRLENIEVGYINDNGTVRVLVNNLMNFVNEETIFNTLNDDKEGKGASLYWAKGDNKIYNLGAVTAQTEGEAVWGLASTQYVIDNIMEKLGFPTNLYNSQNYVYRVTYIPYTDTRAIIEQANIAGLSNTMTKVFNQDVSIVSDRRLGVSTQNQLERLGNNSIVRNYKVDSLLEVPKLGDYIYYDNYIYYCDKVNYLFNENYIEVTCEFSKNFNKIDPRIGIDAEYRQFEIHADDIINRDINLNSYCYISTDRYSDCDIDTQKTCGFSLSRVLFNSLNSTPVSRPESFYLISDKANTELSTTATTYSSYKSDIKNNKETKGFLVPANLYLFKNSVLFTGKMSDNFSAGINAYEKAASSESSGRSNKFIQHDCRYVDDLGNSDYIGITLGTLTSDKLYLDSNGSRTLPELKRTYSPLSFMKDGELTNAIHTGLYYINKDNRESLTFNYQLHFITHDRNIFIHRALIDRLYDNPYKQGDYKDYSPVVALCEKIVSTHDKLTNISASDILNSPELSTYDNVVQLTYSQPVQTFNKTYEGIALIWPNTKEVILSFKMKMEPNQTYNIPNLYFNFSDSKIKYKNK